jgi:hypothetical protein
MGPGLEERSAKWVWSSIREHGGYRYCELYHLDITWDKENRIPSLVTFQPGLVISLPPLLESMIKLTFMLMIVFSDLELSTCVISKCKSIVQRVSPTGFRNPHG